MTKPIRVRWVVTDDLPTLCHIDAGSRDPWGEPQFLTAMKSRRTVPLLAEHADAVVGFLVYRLESDRITIERFATHPDRRRQRVATQLLVRFAHKLLLHYRARAVCAVHEADTVAHFALRSAGFRCTATERDRQELSYVFTYTPTAEQWASAGVRPPSDRAQASSP